MINIGGGCIVFANYHRDFDKLIMISNKWYN